MIRFFFVLWLGTWSTPVWSADFLESENDEVADGNDLLKEGKVAEALEKYDAAARSLPARGAVHLNRGLALARSGDEKLDQAMQAFQMAGDNSKDDGVRARAAANLGNAFFKKEDFEKAISLYKQSLMAAPGNKDVAWNLELARQKKKEQDEQKKNEENQDQQNQDQQNQDQQNQDQQNQDQQNQEEKKEAPEKKEEKKENDSDQKNDSKEQKEQEQPQPKPEPKTRQEVEQVLNSLDDQQKNLMKEMAKQKGAVLPAGRVKDW